MDQEKKTMSNYDHLPDTAKELITLVGYSNTILMMQAWGGVYLDVPQNPNKATELLKVIPYTAVVALCAHYNGERIKYIPKLDSTVRMIRNQTIRAEFGKVPLRKLARKHNLTISTIYSIINTKQAPSNYQLSLPNMPTNTNHLHMLY